VTERGYCWFQSRGVGSLFMPCRMENIGQARSIFAGKPPFAYLWRRNVIGCKEGSSGWNVRCWCRLIKDISNGTREIFLLAWRAAQYRRFGEVPIGVWSAGLGEAVQGLVTGERGLRGGRGQVVASGSKEDRNGLGSHAACN